MGSQLVPVRLSRDLLRVIDMLVEAGVFSSRSEALRELIEAGLEASRGVVKLVEAVNKLFELEREEGDIPVKLSGALRELLEEREAR